MGTDTVQGSGSGLRRWPKGASARLSDRDRSPLPRGSGDFSRYFDQAELRTEEFRGRELSDS